MEEVIDSSKFDDPALASAAHWVIHDDAPDAARITLYDRVHLLTYARLQGVEDAGLDWRTGAREILLCDVDADPVRARRCWDTHLARAHWIATVGFESALEQAVSEDEPLSDHGGRADEGLCHR